ncbi:MAG: hypothetical protein IPM24_25700 [Bryobacterales bacterium]|nr:hypothetical protein [Bryobacterales bacterium]
MARPAWLGCEVLQNQWIAGPPAAGSKRLRWGPDGRYRIAPRRITEPGAGAAHPDDVGRTCGGAVLKMAG